MVEYLAGNRIQGSLKNIVHKFTADGTFTVTGSGNIEYLVVGGGGGGGL